MVKHTQTIRRQFALSVFDHFVILALIGLRCSSFMQVKCNWYRMGIVALTVKRNNLLESFFNKVEDPQADCFG